MTINRNINRARMAWIVRMLRKESMAFRYLRLTSGAVDVSYSVGKGTRNYMAPAKVA